MPLEDVAVMRQVYGQMCVASPEARNVFAKMISEMRRGTYAGIAQAPSEAAAQLAATLSTDGVVDLGVWVDAAKVERMLGHFLPAPVYAGHVVQHSDGIARPLEEVRRAAHYGCYSPEHVLSCPHLIEIANDERLLQIAETYLGCPPTLYSINAWWSFAQGKTAALYSQNLHRDLEELRFLTLFLYLTPVGDNNGPHRYIKHSHTKPTLRQALLQAGIDPAAIPALIDPLFMGHGYDQSARADALLGHLAMVWKGPAGSAILADTYGLHMGIPLVAGDRLMLWVRYGLGPNVGSFDKDGGQYAAIVRERIPQTERARYINRLLLMA